MLITLPREIQRQIVEYIYDVADLRSLRLVSSKITGFATEQLFRNVLIRNTERSAKKFNEILDCKSLAGLVKTVVFHMEEFAYYEYDNNNDDDDDGDSIEFPHCYPTYHDNSPNNFVYSPVHGVIRKMGRGRCKNLSKITIQFLKRNPTVLTDVMFHWQVFRTIIESLHYDGNSARQLHILEIAKILDEMCIVFRLEPYCEGNGVGKKERGRVGNRHWGYVFHRVKEDWSPRSSGSWISGGDLLVWK
ncbi:hypothetical protein BDD12DRAFT_812957 [Trichophaea hybrida]|nr:hypothetical protein BDD12DRAFT_812957 [Trichophaea hybrida]